MRFSKAIRSTPVTPVSAAIILWAKSLAVANVLAVALGVVFFLLSELVSWLLSNPAVGSKLEATGLAFMLSPIVAIFVQIAMAPLIVVAFSFGWAGWAIAVVCGAVVAPLSFFILENFVWSWDLFEIGILIGPVFAALFWVSSALFAPRPNARTVK